MTGTYIRESIDTEAPLSVSEASSVAGNAEGPPAANVGDPVGIDMADRIRAALADDAARSDEVGRLVAEVTDAANAADAAAEEARTRALDPLLSDDGVADARRESDDAEFERDRMREAAKRLGERLVHLQAAERGRAMRDAHEALSAQRAALVGEMERMEPRLAELAQTALKLEALDRELKRQNPILGKTLGYFPPVLASAPKLVKQLFGDAAVLDSFVAAAVMSPPPPLPPLRVISAAAG